MIKLLKRGNRYYSEEQFTHKSLPKKSEAELTEKFLRETPKKNIQRHNPCKVISITERIEARKKEQLLLKFKREYLPYMTEEEQLTILASTKEEVGANIIKICMRIDTEKRLEEML